MPSEGCGLGVRSRWFAAVVLVHVLVVACGGGGDDEASEPDCPTYTPGATPAATTTTVDPRCVERAEERTEERPHGEWRGTFAGTVTWDCGPMGQRTGRLTGEYKITTSADDRALMDGTNTVTGSCAGPTVGTLTTPISVEGKVIEAGFEFPGSLWGPPGTFTINVSGDRGNGDLEGPAPGPARINLVFEIER